ncbi:hypothetical protein G4Z16_00765 [Streptomyces bathyalis]|uniref:Uncharacterized protein n=1 Tax=Streptomyces bathyalis TaxID=2710756 RepID=A0A7T1T2J0_9ACTN|nr:hypothetical protein [Streptomyces bathyalis]QPP05163.1 hypothetical protein G4Z16_00765 [Streptomyces bathyalis]
MEDVLEVIGRQIEERFQLPLHELGAAIAAAPDDNADARDVLYWYGLLAVSQSALERSENELLAALGTSPEEPLSDAQMDLAHQVNAAVGARDGRAMVVRHLLDPNAPGKQSKAIWRGASRAAGRPAPRPGNGPAPHPPGQARGMSR